jgi:hypothetical protein
VDLYGHLMPGSEAEGAALLDAFLDKANASGKVDNETSKNTTQS